MKHKKLLIIEPYHFEPIDSGGKQRAIHTFKELSKRFLTEIIIFPPQKKHFFSFVTHKIPYWFSDWGYIGKIPQRADLYLVEYTQLLHIIDHLPSSGFKIFTAYDISTVSFWRRLIVEKNLFKKIIHFFWWIEIYLYEKKYLSRYDRVVAVSHHDSDQLKKLFHIRNIKVIENGIKKINFLPKRKKDGFINIGFIGSTTHPPNQQAIEFIVNKISPEMTNQSVAHNIILAGDNQICGENIINLGIVENLIDFYGRIDVLVAPIYSGSGSRIKILESLSFGRPVITTSIGAEGIEIQDNYLKIIPIIHQHDPSFWVDSILKISPNTPSINLKNQLSELTWESLFKKF